MSTIVTRSGKGSPLTHVEVDANFTNLNTDKYQEGSAIGGTTPAAGTFTTLTATGQTSLGGVAGSEGFRAYVPTTAGAWLSTRATAAAVFLGNEGTTLPFLVNTNQNSFSIRTGTLGGVSEEQLRVTRTASAVNYVQVTGAATTASPVISVQGSDTNVNLGFVSKGSGEIRFASNANGSNINFRVLHTTSSAVNYGTVTGAVAGSAPVFGVAGTDTNIDLTLTPKGTGQVKIGTNSVAINGPAFYGYNNTNQAAPTVSTWTKCDLNSELFDTNSNFASSRFTPTVAGYYQINATVVYSTAQVSLCTAGIYKNGNVYQQGPTQASATVYNLSFAVLVYLNGSTDYIELYVYCSNTSTIAGGAASTTLSGSLVRTA